MKTRSSLLWLLKTLIIGVKIKNTPSTRITLLIELISLGSLKVFLPFSSLSSLDFAFLLS